MKILYHHRTLADGAEGIHIREMVDAFTSLGHDVTAASVAASKGGVDPSGRWIAIKRRMPQWAFEIAAILLNVLEYFRVRGRIRRERPDLIYKRHALYDVGAILAAERERVPLVLEVNCAYSSPEYRRFEPIWFGGLARWFESRAIGSATLVVAVSSPLAAYLATLTKEPQRVRVIPNGANPSRFDARNARPELVRRRYGLEGKTVAGWVGILRSWHRVDLLARAVAEVPDLVLLVVGDGPDRATLERTVEQLGMRERVVVTGRVPYEEMPDFLAAFDIAVAAADQTGHASPMKLLEYMAMGRATVAPRLANIQDLITDGVDGVLFAPGDTAALARTLAGLSADPALRARLGSNARRTVERGRNWKAIAATVLAGVAERETATQRPRAGS